MWHVSSRSGVATLRVYTCYLITYIAFTAFYILHTLQPLYTVLMGYGILYFRQ